MPRPRRPDLPGVPQHVIQRGNNRASCFFGDADRRFFLRCLAESALRRGCAVHAYVLMANHVHLLVTPLDAGAVAAMLQDVGRRYVRVLNSLHGRTGTLWEGRYRSSLIDSENYLLTCHRYIELNPVRAGIVDDPARYLWSSHGYYALGRPNPVITPHATFLALGASENDRREAFRSLFAEPMSEASLGIIRNAANTNSALGSDAFLSQTSAIVGRSLTPPIRGRPAKSNAEDGSQLDRAAVSGKLL